MEVPEASYHRLESSDEDDGSLHGDNDAIIHTAEGNKTRWHHIEDLDAFFTRVYQYHQSNGFVCIVLKRVFDLFQYLFVVGFAAFLGRCVNYDMLFANKGLNATDKVTIHDVLYLGHQCSARIGESSILVLILLIAAIFWSLQFVKFLREIFLLYEMKAFFTTALHIKPDDIGNITWHEVQQKLMQVQYEQQLCIHKQQLTELDIYNRILRFKNYQVAMVNKDLLPMRYHIPILGETVIFTQGLKYNIEMILFFGPWSLFANNYNLKEEYKRRSNREQLVARLRRQFAFLAVINLLLCPVVLVWHLCYSFFNYAELLKREPGSFGARRWSMYASLYLRHFNELNHEFQARLNRGYKPASRYLTSFSSAVLAIIAKNVVFIAGSILGVVVALTLWDEDVLRVEHILRMVTVLTMVVAIFRSFIPDENAVCCPEQLMKKVLSQVHYMPPSWHGRAHTDLVRKQFSQMFQYKAVFILEELLSPILTPFILYYPMRHRADRMIDFFRNFTVEIAGVGDVCSFAQMDVRRHGDQRWQVTEEKRPPPQPFSKTEGGKTELSLIHFAITNPKWRPSLSEDKFLSTLKSRAHRDALSLSRNDAVQNPLLSSLQSLGSMDFPQGSILQQPMPSIMISTLPQQIPSTSSPTPALSQQQRRRSILQESLPPMSQTYDESTMTSSLPQQPHRSSEIPTTQTRVKRRGGAHNEGSMEGSGLGLMTSVVAGQQGLPLDSMLQLSDGRAMVTSYRSGNLLGEGTGYLTEQAIAELAPVEMGISALYMHELFHNRLMHVDGTANSVIVADDTNSGSYHDDDSPQPSNVYRASDRGSQRFSSNAKQPLLKSSNSGFYPQNCEQTYHSFLQQSQQTMSDEPRPLSRQQTISDEPRLSSRRQQIISDESQRLSGQQTFTPVDFDRRTYSDVSMTTQVQSSNEKVVRNIILGSDIDDESPEIQMAVNRENLTALHQLPSLGFPYDEHQMGNNQYQPPPL